MHSLLKFTKKFNVLGLGNNTCINISTKLIGREINMKKPILYGDEASPPVRFVMMTASVLNVEFELHKIDLFRGENKLEFFNKINPLMKVPAFAMNKQIIRDSHAIALHLCRISKNQNLYPNDNLIRAMIDDFMFFNACALFPVDSLMMTQFFSGKWPLDRNLIDQWTFLINYIESRLQESTWLAGDSMTLSDICCVATITSAALLIPIPKKCVQILEWIKRMEENIFYKYNTIGLERLNTFITAAKQSYNDNDSSSE